MSGSLSASPPRPAAPRLGTAGVLQVGRLALFQSHLLPPPEGAGVLPLPEAPPALSSPSTKQLELWFSSLQEDAGQRLKWERMGLLGYKGGAEGKGSVCWFSVMPE